MINSVRVIGLGKVGELVATLLGDSGFSVTAYDARPRTDLPFETGTLDVRDADAELLFAESNPVSLKAIL